MTCLMKIENVITKRNYKARNGKNRASYHRIQQYHQEFLKIANVALAVSPLTLLIEPKKECIEIKLSEDTEFNRIMKFLTRAENTEIHKIYVTHRAVGDIQRSNFASITESMCLTQTYSLTGRY